jgi:secreted PhoX family phosphatase
MRRSSVALLVTFGLVATTVGIAVAASDFGSTRDQLLASKSQTLFGVRRPIAQSATDSANPAAASADGRLLATFAPGLTTRVVTQGVAAPIIDQMAFWPNDVHPTTLIACNEGVENEPAIQAIDIATGNVTTLLTGTIFCDPMHVTPWGTLVFAEENGGGATGGRFYELIDPLNVSGVTLDRTTGTFSGGTGADHFAVRPALGRGSFEGNAFMPNGVTYYSDENRPNVGIAGGAFFKFVPTTLWNAGDPAITDLSQSPLASGSIFGLRLGRRSGSTDYGHGTSYGLGTWIALPAGPDVDLRAQTTTLKLTGYYRPEDIEIDRGALASGTVKLCDSNTGNEGSDHLWGEVVCLTDGTFADAASNAAIPELQLLVVGSTDLAMPDNLAFQPGRGNWIVHEDGDINITHKDNDLWDCLPDGSDADGLSDGCIRIGVLHDLIANVDEGAEWTGGIFDATGTHFFVSVQHNMTGQGVVLEVTGWK